MVWGSMTWNETGKLVYFNGIMDDFKVYVNNDLKYTRESKRDFHPEAD